MKFVVYAILILTLYILIRKVLPKFKTPKVGATCLVTGAVKGGKTTFAFNLAYQNWKRVHRRWFFRKKLFRKIEEEPLFYSNIPVAFNYVPVTEDIIMRKVRINYGSVVFLDEATLLADSMLFKNEITNENITLFCKLFGHMSHGGMLIVNTQSIKDLHFGFERCISQCFFVHHTTKWIPFLGIQYIREFVADINGNTTNVVTEDFEDKLLPVFFWKSMFKKFDCYAFSTFTDDLPIENTVKKMYKNSDLKVRKLTTFRHFKTIPEKFFYVKCGDDLIKVKKPLFPFGFDDTLDKEIKNEKK